MQELKIGLVTIAFIWATPEFCSSMPGEGEIKDIHPINPPPLVREVLDKEAFFSMKTGQAIQATKFKTIF